MGLWSLLGRRFGDSSSSSSSSSNNVNLQSAQSCDSFLAASAPAQDAHPLSVREDARRRRASRSSLAGPVANTSTAAPPPTVPRYREDARLHRPSTPSYGGINGGSYVAFRSAIRTGERPWSGISMKSPPSLFSRRRESVNPSVSPASYFPSLSRASSTVGDVQTYIPTNAHTQPFARTAPAVSSSLYGRQQQHRPTSQTSHRSYVDLQQHHRPTSQASHRSYVDLLDAHSNIIGPRGTSAHRVKASGLRIYGEDVADRNIGAFGERSGRNPRLNLHSPESSISKSISVPKEKRALVEQESRGGYATDHVLAPDESEGDDTQLSRGEPASKPISTASARSTPSLTSSDSSQARLNAASYAAQGRGERPTSPSNEGVRSDGRAVPAAATNSEVNCTQNDRNQHTVTPTGGSPLPERGRIWLIDDTATTTSTTSAAKSNLPLVQPSIGSPPHRGQSSVATGQAAALNENQRCMTVQSTGIPISSRGAGLSGHYGFPQQAQSSAQSTATSQDRKTTSEEAPPAANSQNEKIIIERASQPPSLDGIVDLSNMVDTKIKTTQPLGVIHEHVTPTTHEIHEKIATRDIHTHHVYDRVVAVIETEILPTKHSVRSQDGKNLIEVPESMVLKHTDTGRLDRNWHISKPGPAMLANGKDECETASLSSVASADSAPDGPVVALARDDSRTRARTSSEASSTNVPFKPVLSSKKEHTAQAGVPSTEQIWRHPPVSETATGQPQPVYVGAGIYDLSAEDYYSDDDDEWGADYGAMRTPAVGEEDLIFRNSGYGADGMLPGLTGMNVPLTGTESVHLGRSIDEEQVGQVAITSISRPMLRVRRQGL